MTGGHAGFAKVVIDDRRFDEITRGRDGIIRGRDGMFRDVTR